MVKILSENVAIPPYNKDGKSSIYGQLTVESYVEIAQVACKDSGESVGTHMENLLKQLEPYRVEPEGVFFDAGSGANAFLGVVSAYGRYAVGAEFMHSTSAGSQGSLNRMVKKFPKLIPPVTWHGDVTRMQHVTGVNCLYFFLGDPKTIDSALDLACAGDSVKLVIGVVVHASDITKTGILTPETVVVKGTVYMEGGEQPYTVFYIGIDPATKENWVRLRRRKNACAASATGGGGGGGDHDDDDDDGVRVLPFFFFPRCF